MRRLFAFLFLIVPALTLAQSVNVPQNEQWTSTTSPSSAITQRTYGKGIKITGLSTGQCLTLDSNNILTTTACGSGAGDITGAASLGTGVNLFDTESSGILRFNTITPGSNVTFSTSTNPNTIVISASGGSGVYSFTPLITGEQSTSTTLRFVNGLISQASSTFSGTFNLLGAFMFHGDAFATSSIQVCLSGCKYSDIDTAIDSAPTGSTIFIKSGTYTVSSGITWPAGKELTLQGEGKNSTIINYTGSGDAFTIGDATTDTRRIKISNIEFKGSSSATAGVKLLRTKNSSFEDFSTRGFSSVSALVLDGTGSFTGDNFFENWLCDTSEKCVEFTTLANSNHFRGVTLRPDNTGIAIDIISGNGNTIFGGLVGNASTSIQIAGDENQVDGIYCEANTLCVGLRNTAQDNQIDVIDVESNTTVVQDQGSQNTVNYTGDTGLTYFNSGNFGIGTTSPARLFSVAGTSLFSGSTIFNPNSGSIQVEVMRPTTADTAGFVLSNQGVARWSEQIFDSTNDLRFRDSANGVTFLTLRSGTIPRVGIATTSPYATLSVGGRGVFDKDVSFDFFTSTSTTATSTIAGGLSITGGGLKIGTLPSTILKTGSSGQVIGAVNGTDYTLITALTCSGSDKLSAVTASGSFTCSTDQTSAGGGTYSFTPTTIGGTVHQATSSPMYFSSGLLAASSTLGYLNVGYFAATSTTATSTFAGGITNAAGEVIANQATFTVGTNYRTADYTTIQAAINACPAAGCLIHVKAGTYTLTASTTIGGGKDKITIEGEGESTVISFNAASVNPAFAVSDGIQHTDIHFRNLSFNQTGGAGSGTAINGAGFARSSFENIKTAGTQIGLDFSSSTSFYNYIENASINISGTDSYGIKFQNGANENTVHRTRIITDSNAVGILIDAHGMECYSCDVETGALIGIDIGINGNDTLLSGVYLEANQTNLRLANGVESVIVSGGFIADATNKDIDDRGTLGLTVDSRVARSDVHYVTGGAKFGINVINPSQTLVVGSTTERGELRINGNSTADFGPSLSLFRSGTADWVLQTGGNAVNTLSFALNPSVYTDAAIKAATKMVLTSSGNVGIGNVNPSEKLNVQGTVAAQIFNATSTSATSTFTGGLDISGGLQLTTLNCSGLSNGGKLTTDSSGNVICGNDTSSAGGGTYSFVPTTIGGTVHQATSSPMYFSSGLLAASSTLGTLTAGAVTATNTAATSTFLGNVLFVDDLVVRPPFTGSGVLIQQQNADEIQFQAFGYRFRDWTGVTQFTLDGSDGHLTSTASATSSFSGGLSVSGGFKIASLNCSGFSNSGKLTTDSAGNVICGNDTSGGSSFSYPFTVTTNFGTTTNATTTSLWLQGGAIYASSTATSTFDGGLQTSGLSIRKSGTGSVPALLQIFNTGSQAGQESIIGFGGFQNNYKNAISSKLNTGGGTSDLIFMYGSGSLSQLNTALVIAGATGHVGLASSTPSVNWGFSIGTSTVLTNGQFANTIASTTAPGATITVDWNKGTTQRFILGQNTSFIINSTSSNPIDGGMYKLKICQDPTGSRTVSYADNGIALRWGAGTTTVTSTANRCTMIGMIYDNTYKIYSVIASSTNLELR